MSESHINEMTQLIYYDFKINEDIAKIIDKSRFNDIGKNYNTIAIIGAQSSGKSTLLNKLFNTNFEMMSSDKGRGQTTKGIWMACHLKTKMLILDCEGTDSKERGESRNKFEHCSSLFALAIADVLILNMWTNDVGRYTASNYGVLKIIFEMNLKLFQQECAKKILIVLRDFDISRHNKQKIEELIMKDINNVWNEIPKPEKYREASFGNFFKFEMITLPHKKYKENEFEEEVKEMRDRLLPDHGRYLFDHIKNEKNIPADGINHYFVQIWNDILSEKDLNIPSQKEMLANYRCSEIRDQALLKFTEEINRFTNESTDKLYNNFKKDCSELVNSILETYDKIASNYEDKIYLSIRNQMKANLSSKFYVCFDNQIKKMIPISQKYFRQDLQKNSNSDDFYNNAIKIKKHYLNDLLNKLEDKRVFDDWIISPEQFNEIFDEIIDNQKNICLDEKKNQIIKSIRKVIDENFSSNLEKYDNNNFWIDFNKDYLNYVYSKMCPLKEYLYDYYNMNETEFISFSEIVETELLQGIKKDFTKKIKDLGTIIAELFKKIFWYDNNVQRNWNKLEENEIDNLFKTCRNRYLDLFENLRYLKIISSPLKAIDYNQINQQTIIDNIKTILEKERDSHEQIIRQNELLSIKRKYEDAISNLLEDAKRRKVGLFTNNLPWWGWCMLIFFGFDDFLNLIQSYWIIPVIMMIGVYFILKQLNLTHVVKNVYFDCEDFISKKKKLIFK